VKKRTVHLATQTTGALFRIHNNHDLAFPFNKPNPDRAAKGGQAGRVISERKFEVPIKLI